MNLFKEHISKTILAFFSSPEFCKLYPMEMFFNAPPRRVLYLNAFENAALHPLEETESVLQHIKQILK